MVNMKRDLGNLRPRVKRGGGSPKGGVRLHRASPVEQGGPRRAGTSSVWLCLRRWRSKTPPRSGEDTDQRLVVSAVQSARTKRLGFWAEADLILHGYEFRSLVRLASGEKGVGPIRKIGHGRDGGQPRCMARKRERGDVVSSVKRADNARRADGPVPSGAGGSRRMAVLASLAGLPARRRSAALPCSGGATRAAAPYLRVGP